MEESIDKATLRRRLLLRQKSLGLRSRSDDAAQLAAHLRTYLQQLDKQYPTHQIGMAGYWALAWEYSLDVFYFHHATGPLWLPRVLCTQQKAMAMIPYDPRATQLTCDAAGIMAPATSQRQQEGGPVVGGFSLGKLESGRATIIVILMPALAVNQRGQRLGYGGGYYDRWLAQLHQRGESSIVLIKLAVVHPDHVATYGGRSDERNHGDLGDFRGDPWDIPMDGVVSPLGLEMWHEVHMMSAASGAP